MITFFSDPHIGLNRQAGTTPTTREIIRRNILSVLMNIPIPGKDVVCLGDLLDKYTNSEEVIRDAAYILQGLELCLAGNHDTKNTAESIGTLQLLQDTVESGCNIATNKFGSAGAHSFIIDGVNIVAVSDMFYPEAITGNMPYYSRHIANPASPSHFSPVSDEVVGIHIDAGWIGPARCYLPVAATLRSGLF